MNVAINVFLAIESQHVSVWWRCHFRFHPPPSTSHTVVYVSYFFLLFFFLVSFCIYSLFFSFFLSFFFSSLRASFLFYFCSFIINSGVALLNNYKQKSHHKTYLKSITYFFLTNRKSTRLNSTPGYISYAVFCLKKKNKISNHTKNY